MNTREDHIAHEMNYCQHYARGTGAAMVCAAGCDINAVQRVVAGDRGRSWGPCIEGHTLREPLSHCSKWIRRTREQGEKRADDLERCLSRMTKVMPVVAEWRKKPPIGKAEVITCPACGGRLHLSQSSFNGHVHGQCETSGCASWME
jgi:hypothetical protein